jgi:hypothetical protein
MMNRTFLSNFFAIICLLIANSLVFGQTVSTLTSSFNGSGGVAVDQSGNIYVGDFGATLSNGNGTTVTKILRDGSLSVFATGVAGASGNAFDSQGNLFQANIAGNRISKITPDGTVTIFATANIVNPVGVAIDSIMIGIFIRVISGMATLSKSLHKVAPRFLRLYQVAAMRT